MALIVVGGQAKDVGKTTLVCNIIAAFPQVRWTAVKVTTDAHRLPDCEVVIQKEGASIWRETRRGQHTDTARFLDAGARDAFLVEAAARSVQPVCEALLEQRKQNTHIILESTRAAEFLHPSLFLLVVKDSAASKRSATDQLERADALVLRGSEKQLSVAWDKPLFAAKLEGLDPRLHSLISKLID